MALRYGLTALALRSSRPLSASLGCVRLLSTNAGLHGSEAKELKTVKELKVRHGLAKQKPINDPLACVADNPLQVITVDGALDISPFTGVPDEHRGPRKVLIKRPTKNAMQSGTDNTLVWKMSWDNQQRWENDLMGWASSADPLSNLDVSFFSAEEAAEFCEKNGWQWEIQEPPCKPPRSASYAANFSWNKRTRRSSK